MTSTKRAGHLYVGVGVGALIFNAEGLVFLAQRGPLASNECGAWEDLGGEVEFGEPLAAAACREAFEEFGLIIRPVEQLAACDHLLDGGREHWVSVAFLAWYVSGVPRIMEPGKCCDFGWFPLDALPTPLTAASAEHFRAYRMRYGTAPSSAPVEGHGSHVPAAMMTRWIAAPGGGRGEARSVSLALANGRGEMR
jgi:8-oxo-dGTP diphosphatase